MHPIMPSTKRNGIRAPFQFTSEGELGNGVKEAREIQRWFEGRAEVQRLAPAAGLPAARIGIGTSSEGRGVFRVVLGAAWLFRLFLFAGLGYAPVPVALYESVDQREDEEEYDRVDEQA